MHNKLETQPVDITNSIELVIFDCDGVLVDSEVICVDVLRAELQNFGVNISIDYFYQHFLGRSITHVQESILDNFNVNLGADFESHYQQHLLQVFASALQPTKGINTVLEQLNTPYCVATSSSRSRTLRALELTQLDRHFDNNVFTASQVKHGKPAPDLFLFAAQQMGVKPEHCLVIEDSLAGLQAARAAGMLVWHFVGGSHLQTDEKVILELLAGVNKNLPITRFSSWQNFYKMAPMLKKPR